jgi:hypothetical protein
MTSLTKKQIDWLDKCAKGRWTLNHKTGLVDVDGYFDCSDQRLKGFKGVKFGKVENSFSCNDNQLTSLVGSPQEVGVGFHCRNNQLTSLEGAPQKVGGSFFCYNNRLTSLEGAPHKVGGGFNCGSNPVSEKTLFAIFEKMKGGHSFVIAAASLRNEMSKTSWKLIAPHIPDAIQPGVSMLARFGVFK